MMNTATDPLETIVCLKVHQQALETTMHRKENKAKKAHVATNDKKGKIALTGKSCSSEGSPKEEGKDESMAVKVAAKKAMPKKSRPKKAAPKVAASAKVSVAPKASTAPKAPSSRSRIPNAASLRAMAQHKAGNLTQCADEVDLFRKLGIKVGKA